MEERCCSKERPAAGRDSPHHKTLTGRIAVACVLLLIALRVGAQAATHQRIGVEGTAPLMLVAGISVETVGIENKGGTALEIDQSFIFEALYGQRFGLSVEVPIALKLALGRSISPRIAAAAGDPGFSLSYTFRVDDWRLGVELSYSHPLGIWNSYEADEMNIMSGSGYRKIGVSCSSVRYMDPLIAGVAISADSYFDRKERCGSGCRPLVLTASLYATEALNNIVALTGGLSQRLAWPLRSDESPAETGLSYSLSGRMSIVFTEGRRTTSLGISKLLSAASSPIVFAVGFMFRLSTKEG